MPSLKLIEHRQDRLDIFLSAFGCRIKHLHLFCADMLGLAQVLINRSAHNCRHWLLSVLCTLS